MDKDRMKERYRRLRTGLPELCRAINGENRHTIAMEAQRLQNLLAEINEEAKKPP